MNWTSTIMVGIGIGLLIGSFDLSLAQGIAIAAGGNLICHGLVWGMRS